jgi:hypothetical protein
MQGGVGHGVLQDFEHVCHELGGSTIRARVKVGVGREVVSYVWGTHVNRDGACDEGVEGLLGDGVVAVCCIWVGRRRRVGGCWFATWWGLVNPAIYFTSPTVLESEDERVAGQDLLLDGPPVTGKLILADPSSPMLSEDLLTDVVGLQAGPKGVDSSTQ